ncbi:MAG: hypothetical protein ACLFUB_12010 [Cyclobacteriaceae bacterium]
MRKILIFFSLLLLVVISGWVATRLLAWFWISPVLEAVFKESVSYYTDDLYQVDYDDLQIRPLDQEVRFVNFRLSYDSSRVRAEDSLQSRSWMKGSADELRLNLNNLWQMIPGRYLDVEQLYLSQPMLQVDAYAPSRDTFRLEELSDFNSYQLIRHYFDSLRVEDISIKNARLKWNNYYLKTNQQFGIGDIRAQIEGLRVNPARAKRNFGYPTADVFKLEVDSIRYFTADSLYVISSGRIKADPVRQELILDDFSLVPQYSNYQFARQVGYQQDRISLNVPEIRLEGVNLHYLLADQAIIARRFLISQADLQVFKDKRLNRPEKAEKPMLQQILQDIRIPFRLDTLMLKEGSIVYAEHVPEGNKAGRVSFSPVYMTAYNITNLDSLVLKNIHLVADIRARLMSEGWLDLHLDFPLNNQQGYHRLSGKLSPMALSAMNEILEPTAFATVNSGFSDDLQFVIEADEIQSGGEVHFRYNDLKIELLNKDQPEDLKLRQKIGSFLANNFVIKTNNPSGKQDLRVGEVFFRREAGKSIFSYWWQSLLSGLKESIGLKNNDKPEPEKKKKRKPGLLKRIFDSGGGR